ncbi:MAG: hypothetical protein K2J36_07675 [Ruminococcus sp.]|nr:hypothetical protein [Ruminococcus sp.]MDE6672180.1 hypothetical protein [Ruminococcus sp.]MDE6797873.1 hypothetical protein [Ruminococcus sp.]
MATYTMKFMYDWGSGVCLWSTNQASKAKFNNYPIFTSQLPVSNDLKEKLEHLIEWHDEALNWEEPNSDLLWNEKQIDEFLNVSKKTFFRLCEELGSDYEIEFIEGM